MGEKLSFFEQTDAQSHKKKPTQPHPETSGFNCVGLLTNWSRRQAGLPFI